MSMWTSPKYKMLCTTEGKHMLLECGRIFIINVEEVPDKGLKGKEFDMVFIDEVTEL